MIPIGIGFISLGLSAMLPISPDRPLSVVGSVVFLVVGLIAVTVGLIGTYRPPERAKPRWLREEEARNGIPRDSVAGRRFDSLTMWMLLGLAILIVTAAAIGGLQLLLSSM